TGGYVELINQLEVIPQRCEFFGNLDARFCQFDNLVEPRIRTAFREKKALKRLLDNLLAQKAGLRKVPLPKSELSKGEIFFGSDEPLLMRLHGRQLCLWTGFHPERRG